MDNQIWLVIWEWEAFRGASVPENIKAVKALTARGVLCSVCGSDEEAAAKRQLEDWGVWEDLAAPSVDLAPLSIIDRVNNIICAVRATPRSALYVDAGGSISWPENIRGARPSDLAALLEGPLLAGFPDPLHIRLAQAQWMDRLARRADWKERLLAAAKTSLLNADLPGVLAAQTARRKRDLDKCRAEMAALHCAGINLYQYFEERGVQTIDIAADQEMARLVMEDAPAAKIKIARLLTLGSPFILETDLGLNTYSFASLPDEHPDSHPDNCPDNPPDGECAAMAAYPPDSAEAEMIRQYISGRLFWLPDVIHALCTKHIFARKVKRIVRKRSHVPIIVLRLPTGRSLQQTDAAPGAEPPLAETMTLPESKWGADNVWRFENQAGFYVNVLEPTKSSVYLFGGRLVFGQGVSDRETLGAYLQKFIGGSRRVVNCANHEWPEDAGRMFSLMDSMIFQKNDLVVIGLEDSDDAPFQYQFIEGALFKADPLPVLDRTDIRPDICPDIRPGNMYTARAYEKIALFLRDKIPGVQPEALYFNRREGGH